MRILRRPFVFLYAILMVLGLLAPPNTTLVAAQAAPAQVDWLEPHGIGVIDLVGVVPDDILKDAVIVYSNNGMLQYISGQRTGDTVTINATVIPRYGGAGAGETPHTLINCLGQPALTDSWPIVSPAGTMRVYEDGVEITSEAWLQRFSPGGRIHPLRDPNHFRYPEGDTTEVTLTEDGALPFPVNRGCAIVFPEYRQNLTATFTIQTPRYISARVLGSETFTFHSYVGPGDTGAIDGLASQLKRRYPNRHDKFDLTIPAGAEFALVTFPPTPVHPYVNEPIDLNLALPGSGTYRIGRQNSLNLSVDHAVTMGLPLYWQTRDVDQSPDTEFLPSFTNPGYLASMEYFVPTGIPYHRCMRVGNCSNALVQSIYEAEMEMTIHYLTVDRIALGLDLIPLRQAGPSWSPGLAVAEVGEPATFGGLIAAPVELPALYHQSGPTRAASAQVAQPSLVPGTVPPAQSNLYLPMIWSDIPPVVPPDDPTNCPCGWFAPDGRMVDFVSGPS
jgi:hypothetical protein